MRSLAPMVLLLPLLMQAVSCSTEQSESDLSTQPRTRPNPVIITMGGYNSCGEDIRGNSTPIGNERWTKGATLSEKFAGVTSLWIRSCFDKWGYVRYIWSGEPNIIRATQISDLTGFVSRIAVLSAQGRNPVFMIGHSYGGWMALEIARQLPEHVNVAGISTNDPISPRHCTPLNYVAALGDPIGALAGCRRAPSDITNEMRTQVLARIPTGAWRHYYQRNFIPLASSEFPGSAQPHLSQDLSPFLKLGSGVRPSFNAHTAIDQLSIVWYSFEVSIDNVVNSLL